MFLDEQNLFSGPAPAPPPRRTFAHEKAVSRIVLIALLILLVLPVSAGGLAALVRYLMR